MKAIVCTKYGAPEVLSLEHIDDPIPKDNEVLVKIICTSVTAADYRIRALNVPTGFSLLMRAAMGFTKPRKKVLGMNFSGEVKSIGKNVEEFKVGDSVFGTSGMEFGAYAEYLSIEESAVMELKPASMSFEEAAAFPFGALTALSFLRDKAKLQDKEKIFIYGASGAVGTASVQLAKYYGADVTAVCSTANLDLVKSLGADKVIDYTRENFFENGDSYDIIFDTVGKTSVSLCQSSLKPKGRYLAAVAGIPLHIQMLFKSLGNKKYIGGVASETREDLTFLKGLFETGDIKMVIDKCYPLEQIVEAHRYAEKGHKKGNVVINVGKV